LNKFFSELRRRNVFRVAGVYAVVGWLLIQIAVAVLPTFGAPNWIAQTFIALIFLGFPIAVILAWAFELTPEGMKRTSTVGEDASITHQTGKHLDIILAAMAALLVVVIIGDRLFPSSKAGARSTGAHEDFSIAVLPFSDMSPEGDQEYFADGISEELLNVLAQVPGLEVAGRTSSFAFKGQNTDLREIGKMLDVAHVLEGSVRKSGNKVRVTAQLIRADNGFHMWSDTYDGDLTDIFAVQDEIANAILVELKPQLMGKVTPLAAPRTDITAYDFYLLAQQKAVNGSLDSYSEAAAALDKALAIDPEFVPALAWRGYYELMLSDGAGAVGNIPIEDALKTSAVWVNRAISLDRNSADALFAQAGRLSFAADATTRLQAEAFYKRALELKPNFALARNDYGYWLRDQKRAKEATAQFELALEHDPAQSDVNTNLVFDYLRNRELDKARNLLDRWEKIAPDQSNAAGFRAVIESINGNLAQALRVIEAGEAEGQKSNVIYFNKLQLLMTLGEFDRVISGDDEVSAVYALAYAGRLKEALAKSAALVSDRPDYPRYQRMNLTILFHAGKWADIVQYYDEKWGSLEALQSTVPNPAYDVIAPALLAAGHKDGPAALEAWRALNASGKADGRRDLSLDSARIAMAEGNTVKAMDELEAWTDAGYRDISLFIDQSFSSLRTTPRFIALRDKVSKLINAERVKLGLQPIEMPRPQK
jgi:TolB-like protein/Tfp pilus assembly protein PilF